MSAINGATGLGPTAGSTRHVSSSNRGYWDAFQERRKRERVRAALYDELKDIGIARGEID